MSFIMVVAITVSLATVFPAGAQDKSEPTCRDSAVDAEIARLEAQLNQLKQDEERAQKQADEAQQQYAECRRAIEEAVKSGAPTRPSIDPYHPCPEQEAAAKAAIDSVIKIVQSEHGIELALEKLKALPRCTEPPPPPPPPPKPDPPVPPAPDPKPPGAGVPRNMTVTHRGSCPRCGDIAAKFNAAADEYAAAVNRGTVDAPVLKFEMDELGHELDACEQKLCTPSGGAPIKIGPRPADKSDLPPPPTATTPGAPGRTYTPKDDRPTPPPYRPGGLPSPR